MKAFNKKILAVLMGLSLCLMAGCGNGAAADTDMQETPKEESASLETSAAENETEPEDADQADGGASYKIGFSQCTMNHGWRVCMLEDNVNWAKENWPEAEIIVTNADDSEVQQVSDMEDLIAAECDLILISPLTSEALTDVCQKAMDAGIKVVTIDREVNCEVTAHIGGDNLEIAGMDAEYLIELTGGKGTIIECAGTSGSSVTNDRHDGFASKLEGTELSIIDSQDCDFARATAMEYVEDMLGKYDPSEITAIYCHNDEMAMGAYLALDAAGCLGEIYILSCDGQNDVIDAIVEGNITQTAVYSTCAPEAMILAKTILEGGAYDQRVIPESVVINSSNAEEYVGTGY